MGLQGKIIIYTRPYTDNDNLKEFLIAGGSFLLHVPLIETVFLGIDKHSKDISEIIEDFSCIIFTSRNGVKYFIEMMNSLGKSSDILSRKKIAVYGKKTSLEIEIYGFRTAYSSEAPTSELFFEEINGGILDENEKILLVQGHLAGDKLLNELKCKYYTERINVYKTLEIREISEDIINMIKYDKYDLLVFASPSAFNSFLSVMRAKDIDAGFRISCIGATTADAVIAAGYKPLLVSSKPDAESFGRVIENYFNV